MIRTIYKMINLIIFIIAFSIIISGCPILDNEVPKWNINKDNGK